MLLCAPSAIGFSQDTISRVFRNKESVNGAIDRIFSKQLAVEDFPAVSVVWKDSKFYSIDNRRLYVFRVLQVEGVVSEIPIRLIGYDHRSHARKFTTKNKGMSVMVRGGVTFQHVISRRAPPGQTPYKQKARRSGACHSDTDRLKAKSETGYFCQKHSLADRLKKSVGLEGGYCENSEVKGADSYLSPLERQLNGLYITTSPRENSLVGQNRDISSSVTKGDIAGIIPVQRAFTRSTAGNNCRNSYETFAHQTEGSDRLRQVVRWKYKTKTIIEPSKILFTLKSVNESEDVYNALIESLVSKHLARFSRYLQVLSYRDRYYCFPNHKNNIRLYILKALEAKQCIKLCKVNVTEIKEDLSSYSYITFSGDVLKHVAPDLDFLTRFFRPLSAASESSDKMVL